MERFAYSSNLLSLHTGCASILVSVLRSVRFSPGTSYSTVVLFTFYPCGPDCVNFHQIDKNFLIPFLYLAKANFNMFTKHAILVASALASYVSASCLHGTSLLPRTELPGGKVAVSTFGYTGLQGPLNWAGLATANSACASSKVQSPINIDDTIGLAKKAPVVKIDSVQNAEIENLGTTVEIIVNGTTTFAGKDFSLKQFHFHTPSEHRIAEEYFPLEMHMVHEAAGM